MHTASHQPSLRGTEWSAHPHVVAAASCNFAHRRQYFFINSGCRTHTGWSVQQVCANRCMSAAVTAAAAPVSPAQQCSCLPQPSCVPHSCCDHLLPHCYSKPLAMHLLSGLMLSSCNCCKQHPHVHFVVIINLLLERFSLVFTEGLKPAQYFALLVHTHLNLIE